MKTGKISRILLAAGWLSVVTHAGSAFGQAVAVTAALDAPTIAAGQTTTLRVFAQVKPEFRASADQIFSWYLDVQNTNGSAVAANYAALVKPTSDNDPLLSSTGTADGAHRRGIYDFFITRPGAGVSAPVELMRISITGQVAGRTRFVVSAGTGVDGFGADFLVLPLAEGEPLTGGDYTAAFADLVVTGTAGCVPELQMAPLAGGPAGTWQLSFTPCVGRTHTVESRVGLEAGGTWTALPGAPHNSGSLTVTNNATSRFFRVRVDGP